MFFKRLVPSITNVELLATYSQNIFLVQLINPKQIILQT